MSYALSSRAIASQRGAGLLSSLGAALSRRRIYTRTLSELRNLTDGELADLGIARHSIADVAREAAYGK